MELQEALTQISEIRQQMARSQVFRGYRSMTVGFSGLVAIGAALWQRWEIPDPAHQIFSYLELWVSAATLSALVAGAEMAWRARRSQSRLQGQITLLAVEQFLPCLVAGAMLTYVLLHFSPFNLWMLPGLWAILFSLGGYASCRLLPRPMFWAAGYYLIAGLLCLVYGQGKDAFSPWAMGLTFGVGQLLTAAILYWTLERNHDF
jgi:hypothetical protein